MLVRKTLSTGGVRTRERLHPLVAGTQVHVEIAALTCREIRSYDYQPIQMTQENLGEVLVAPWDGTCERLLQLRDIALPFMNLRQVKYLHHSMARMRERDRDP